MIDARMELTEAEKESRDRAALTFALRVSLLSFAVTATYAISRYVVFGPIKVVHIPIFVLNKAFSWTGLTLLCATLALGPAARCWPDRYAAKLAYRKLLGLFGFMAVTGHVLLSLMVLNYGTYRGYFVQAFELNALAEFTLAAGAWGWLLLLPPMAVSIPQVRESISPRAWRSVQNCLPLVLLLAVVHMLKDAPTWWQPRDWPGGMPPISLLTVLMAVAVLVFYFAVTGRVARGS